MNSSLILFFYFFVTIIEEASSAEMVTSPISSNVNINEATTEDATKSIEFTNSDPWPSQSDEDIDRLVANYQGRQNSLSSLGVSILMVYA